MKWKFELKSLRKDALYKKYETMSRITFFSTINGRNI